MLTVEYDKNMLAKVEKKLGSMKSEAGNVLKKALNDTAKQARKQLAEEAQKTYVVKSGKFNKSMKIKNATAGNLKAVINSSGGVMELKDFKVSPAKYATGLNRPTAIKAKVLKSGGMKTLEKGGIKAFIGKFANGHVSVMQRRGNERLPVKKLLSPSIPKMIGSEKRVYGIVQPDIGKNLQMNVQKHIAKVLGG